MMVNRVFCYSEDVAKKNCINLPIIYLVLLIVVFIVWIIVGVMVFDSMIPFSITFFVFITLILYFSIIAGSKTRSKITAYATDTNGRIFKAMIVNNGQGLGIGGIAAGGLIDQLAGSDSNIGESIGGVVGSVAQIYAMNRSVKYMSNPEIVAKIVETAPNITGAEVFEILKVHDIVNRNKSIKVKCDYKNLRTNKVKYRKSLTIEKSYNMFDDLIDVLNTHR